MDTGQCLLAFQLVKSRVSLKYQEHGMLIRFYPQLTNQVIQLSNLSSETKKYNKVNNKQVLI